MLAGGKHMYEGMGVVFALDLPAEERLVGQRRVVRGRTSNASTSCKRCLACAEDTDIDGREGTWFQPKAAHMQPFAAAFTLHHRLTIICAVANASCRIG